MRRNEFEYSISFIIFFLIAIILTTQGQNDSAASSKEKNIRSLNLGIHHGFIFAHTPEVENTKGAHPTGVELIFSWQRRDVSMWNLCNCFPRKGLLLAYYDYDTRILGKSYSAAYFLEPTYRIGKKLFFSFKAVAGLSYLTNPYDTMRNPTNRSYSTNFSNYLLVGTGLWFQINDYWWLNGSINYQHESNGGSKQPNRGINWPTAGLAVSYQLNPRPYYSGPRNKEKFWKDFSIRWDVGLYGFAKRVLDENGNSLRKPLLGAVFKGNKQVGKINFLTAGFEIFNDRALHTKLRIDTIDKSPVRSGLLFGHEFILGKFLFSQQLGVYIFDQTPYFHPIYHRWGIHYRINKNWGVGLHLLAHGRQADFTDLRLTYSWQKKGSPR